MTPIRETIARAIFDKIAADPNAWEGPAPTSGFTWRMPFSHDGVRCLCVVQADAVLRALDEAGCVVVRKEPMPEAVGAWWRVKNGHHYHDEPPPTDTSDYAAYRAMISASVVE